MKQGEKTRLLILEAADRLFYQRGYTNTSFSHIFDATGLSKGNITYHFKSKQAILEAIIKQRLEKINALLESWEKESENPVERLQKFCGMLVAEEEMLKAYGCPMGTITGEFSKFEPHLHQIVLPMFERFRQWLGEQFLLLGEERADEKAMELLGYAQGIAVLTHAFKDTGFLEREVEKLKHSLENTYR